MELVIPRLWCKFQTVFYAIPSMASTSKSKTPAIKVTAQPALSATSGETSGPVAATSASL